MQNIPFGLFGLIGLAVGLLAWLLRASANRPAFRDPATRELVLQCSFGYVWLTAVLTITTVAGLTALSLFTPIKDYQDVLMLLGMSAFFIPLNAIMWAWCVRRRTRVGPGGLTSEYVFYSPRLLPWTDVKRMSCAGTLEFWVHGSGGRKALLHLWFQGIREVVPLLHEHLPAAVREQDAKILAKFETAVGIPG